MQAKPHQRCDSRAPLCVVTRLNEQTDYVIARPTKMTKDSEAKGKEPEDEEQEEGGGITDVQDENAEFQKRPWTAVNNAGRWVYMETKLCSAIDKIQDARNRNDHSESSKSEVREFHALGGRKRKQEENDENDGEECCAKKRLREDPGVMNLKPSGTDPGAINVNMRCAKRSMSSPTSVLVKRHPDYHTEIHIIDAPTLFSVHDAEQFYPSMREIKDLEPKETMEMMDIVEHPPKRVLIDVRADPGVVHLRPSGTDPGAINLKMCCAMRSTSSPIRIIVKRHTDYQTEMHIFDAWTLVSIHDAAEVNKRLDVIEEYNAEN